MSLRPLESGASTSANRPHFSQCFSFFVDYFIFFKNKDEWTQQWYEDRLVPGVSSSKHPRLSLIYLFSFLLFVSLPGDSSRTEDLDQMTLNKILARTKLHPDPLSSESSHDTFFEAMGRVRHVADQVRIYTLLIGGLRSMFSIFCVDWLHLEHALTRVAVFLFSKS
jgi:hypothetical protein